MPPNQFLPGLILSQDPIVPHRKKLVRDRKNSCLPALYTLGHWLLQHWSLLALMYRLSSMFLIFVWSTFQKHPWGLQTFSMSSLQRPMYQKHSQNTFTKSFIVLSSDTPPRYPARKMSLISALMILMKSCRF